MVPRFGLPFLTRLLDEDMAVAQYSCFRKTPSSRGNIYSANLSLESPSPFVCSVRRGAVVAAAAMPGNAVSEVTCYMKSSRHHSPLPLAFAGDMRSGSFAKLAPK